jgi:hypothetical protein
MGLHLLTHRCHFVVILLVEIMSIGKRKKNRLPNESAAGFAGKSGG